MLAAYVLLSICAAVMGAPPNLHNPPAAPNLDLLLNHGDLHNVNGLTSKREADRPIENMYNALDVQSMVKAFDPKLVVVNEQHGELPAGIHDALVKSLISDLHAADVPVVYAQKRNIPLA
uniref:Uncharacterized protein n=1 Tax=Homalodisca liturata TaxID=320908 RepID=A0A1B6IYV8_9HEMI